jgi:hypothetical protein
MLTVSTTPFGRVDGTTSVGNAEGATTPESLRQTDRRVETTLESERQVFLAFGRRHVPVRRRGKPSGETLRYQ